MSCTKETEPVSLGFGKEFSYPTHREISVGWESDDGAILSGTLILPKNLGLYPAVIWHFGSNKWTRQRYDLSAAPRWLEAGIAVLTYDKRGVGKSQGFCCPWSEPDYFPLLASDVLSGVRAMANHPEIDPLKIGAFGFSQGGWVVPVAAAKSDGDIAFTVIGSGPTVSLGEELLYSQLTGENNCEATGISKEDIARQLHEAGPSLFDPRSFLETMTNPGLWVFGENDLSVPVDQSINILDSLIVYQNKDFQHYTIPNANHSWIVGGGICTQLGQSVNILPFILEWIQDHI